MWCKCKGCGYVWQYDGKMDHPDSLITCPCCYRKIKRLIAEGYYESENKEVSETIIPENKAPTPPEVINNG